MNLIPISTGILKQGDDIAAEVAAKFAAKDGDVIVISSKAVATVEGAAYDLRAITPSDEAKTLAESCGKSPEFREAMLMELKRMHGSIVRKNRFAILTEVKPDGMDGSILVASAGLDESNAGENKAVGWPHDPVKSVMNLRDAIKKKTGVNMAIIISDSCCRPRRLGVTAFALTACGIEPMEDLVGTKDLFGHELRVTKEARADQLAVAANFLMGNSDESIPAVVIRDHGLAMTDFCGWVPAINKEEDMFEIG